MLSTVDAFEFPRVGVQNFQALGQNTFTDLKIAPTTHSVNVNATKVWGEHTIKMGSDFRVFQLNFTQLFFPSGQFSFNNAQWTQRNPNVASGTQGAALASMLLGIPSGVNLSHNPDPASTSQYFGGYLQDDWKLARNFTVNLGIRYEFDVPRTERFNRLSYFDETATSPLANQVPANGFFDPSQLKGAVVFVDDANRRQVDTDYDNISPRIGFAWNFAEKTVVRGGYGIFYMPSHVQAAGHSGSAGMMGYNTQSDMIVSLDGRTPFRYIDNPFPDGFNLPPGDTLGASTNLGLGIGGGTGGVFTTNQVPHMQQWNVNVQRELPGNIITEVAYIGSRGTDLLIGESGLAVRPGRPVVPEPRHRPAGPGAEPVLRDHHQPVVAAALRRPSRATACCGRIRSTTACRRSACRARSRSTTASRRAPTSASRRASACWRRTRWAS